MGNFSTLPAYRNLVRNLVTEKVTMFKGLNIYSSYPNIGPEAALQLLNVIVSYSGQLSKLRYPILIVDSALGAGPGRIYDFQQASGTRHLITIQGNTIKIFNTNAAYAVLLTDVNANHIGAFPTSIVTANNVAFLANGVEMIKWTGLALQKWGIQKPTVVPVLGAPVAGALTFVLGGRNYRYSYGNSVTGHIGAASEPAAAGTGNLVAKNQPVTAAGPAPADGQVDTLYWWSTLDGGSDYYLNTSGAIAGLLAYTDNVLDAALQTDKAAPLLNSPPPIGNFLAVFQGRIFIFNLTGAPQDIAYSGYERIFLGRPEESFPSFNRLKLSTGADQLAGGGVIQAGVIAFSRSNQMFMFRGVVEDIVTNNPLLFSSYLEQLPWDIGCMIHETIASTPYGLVWWASDLSVQIYNGQDKPVDLSIAVTALLRDSTAAQRTNARGRYFSWLDRSWYALTFAYNGSATNNRIIFFDLDPNPETNVGAWISDIQADDIGVIEDTDGRRRLCITSGGKVFEVFVQSDAVNGITLTPNPAATGNVLNAYWQSGYFGRESPQTRKMMRTADINSDFGALMPAPTAYLVDADQGYPYKNPLVKVLGWDGKRKATVNLKGRAISYLITFPTNDNSYNVIELVHNMRPTGDS